MTRSSDLLSQSLALAIARYLNDHDGAADRAGAWLDDDVRARLDSTAEQIAEEAATGLEELEHGVTRPSATSGRPAAWSSSRRS